MPNITIINGPNLNLLGKREPGVYGNETFDDFFAQLKKDFPQVNFTYFQSNVEGELVNAIQQYGFNVIIAESFADIFFNNSINNGMLLISLSSANIELLFNRSKQGPQQWQIDLANQEILLGNNAAVGFSIDPDVKQRLLSGLDFIGASETLNPQIAAFEQQRRQQCPWLG